MGDAAVQKMMETKKAYVNVTLHCAQEAAARIMISERKAFRIQSEAEYAKQEALGMLIRLKQTMDSKMHKAEVLSIRQKKKIKELEEQLQEAKCTVRELREELAFVCDELERAEKREQSKTLMNIQSNCAPHGIEYAETSNCIDASGSIMESCINSKLGPNSTFRDNTSTLAKRKDDCQSQKTRDTALLPRFQDVPYLPSIIKRTRVPPIYANRLSQGIHSLIGKKLSGSSSSTGDMAGSEKTLIADSNMIDLPTVNKNSGFGRKKVHDELAAKGMGLNHNVPEKQLHGEEKRHVEYANSDAPLYEHISTWDLTFDETTGHFPSRNAVNGSSPSLENVKCSKIEAEKARLTETHYLKLPPGYVRTEEKNANLKPCSFKNTSENDHKEADVLTRETVEVVRPLSTRVGTMNPDLDIMPCNSNAGPGSGNLTKSSFPYTTNIIHYTRKRSRHVKENTNPCCDKEASPELVCLKRKASECRFDLLPGLNIQASGLKSTQNWESQSIAQAAHQLLALSDRKWFR